MIHNSFAKIVRCLGLACSLAVAGHSNAQLSAPLYTIPVVFHILHEGGAENISDAQVIDAVNILNRDFQKLNPDTITVVPSFSNNIANVQFHFQLAGIDPQGNCTNGIIRHYTKKATWIAGDLSYYTYSWPSNKYLNFYIVKSLNVNAGSYTYLPGTIAPAADAIVAINNYCGSIGTANVNSSRWLTQKVGHWFNLMNTWGMSPSLPTTCGNDGVADTPPTKGFMNCNLTNAAICNATVIENVQNYMDGSPCRCMFTNGQKTRMHACITSTVAGRNNLSAPANLLATGVTSSTTNCVPQLEMGVFPSSIVCVGAPLTIKAFTSNANSTLFSWSGSNGLSVSGLTLATITITAATPGPVTISCIASNANGAATASMVITVVSNTADINTTYKESFENSSSMPPNWVVVDPNTPTSVWGVMNGAGSHGSRCVMVNTEGAPGGALEILQTPSYDFAANPGMPFTFKYAYARKSSTHNDLFKVQASKDCGATWKDIYVPPISVLASGSGDTLNALFVPTAAQWKSYTLTTHPNFSSFLNENNVLIRFYFKEDSLVGYGNRIYLDQINLGFPGPDDFTGLENRGKDLFDLNVYPNPAQNKAWLSFNLSTTANVRYSITDVKGSVILQEEINAVSGKNDIPINEADHLEPGIYFVALELNELKSVRKLIVIGKG